MKNLFKFGFFAIALLFASGVSAQKLEVDAVTRVVESLTSNDQPNLGNISKHISAIEENLKNGQFTMDFLSGSVKVLNDYRTKLINARKQNEKELQFILKRIEALGSPEDGIEVESITAKRREFNDEASLQKGLIAEADVMLARIDELDVLILNVRNREIIGNLLSQQRPLILPQNFLHTSSLFVKFFVDILKSPVNWYHSLDAVQQANIHLKFIPGTLIFILLLWFAVRIRLFIMQHFGYEDEIKNPRFGKKVFAALLVALAYGVIPAVLIASFIMWIYGTKIVADSFFGIVLNSALTYLLIAFLAKAFARVIFAPYHPRWRLVNMETEQAKKITKALYLAIVSICFCTFLERIAVSANYPIDLISFLSIISSAIKGMFIIILTKALLLDEVNSTDDDDEDDDTEETPQAEVLSRAVKISFLTMLGVAFVFAISLFGYARLSAFIFNRFKL